MDEKAALTLRKQTAATPVRNVCFTKLAFSVIFNHEYLSGRCSNGRRVAVGPLVRATPGRCAPDRPDHRRVAVTVLQGCRVAAQPAGRVNAQLGAGSLQD